jgi:hypothetical protein
MVEELGLNLRAATGVAPRNDRGCDDESETTLVPPREPLTITR